MTGLYYDPRLSSSRLLSAILFLILAASTASANGKIFNDTGRHFLEISNRNLVIRVDYDKRCVIDELRVGKRIVLDGSHGGFTGVLVDSTLFNSASLVYSPRVAVTDSSAVLSDIVYGTKTHTIRESWTFTLEGNDIVWRLVRELKEPLSVDDDAFPVFNFRTLDEYEAALLGNGGVAWFRLFNDSAVAYGVHTNLATFWSADQPESLQMSSQTVPHHGAIKFFRSNGQIGCSFTCSPSPLGYRYDPGTNRRRYIRGGTDVWHRAIYPVGKYEQVLRISAPSYEKTLGRGKFRGVDGNAVTAILNTIARLGVIDSKLYGGNSWHTPYGPICLHEQYIAQFGVGIDDKNYIDGYKECLDYYRDHAVEPDGRVKARWAYTNEDASPGSADSLGFYEAQWGILLDSNPDFVINVADLFNQCGDVSWLRSQKTTCERALNYMLRRDSNHDSLVEMIPRTHLEHKSSDWIDVIWASWEDAFVNAELYHALTLWSGLEELMGDSSEAKEYSTFAAGLKRHFNLPIADGGFWDPAHGWYVYWREPDGSIWGDNLVTPVNFMAIGYGICDSQSRRMSILHAVDNEMEKENLFFWPISMFPYEAGAGGPQNYPYPNYENGDLFLSWGELAVRAYSKDYPEIALMYIRRLIAKYKEDGLAYQRYLRATQKGAGDDILAGNASAIVGLYRDIYGIQPQYNRLYLDPHLVGSLYGTVLRYWFQGSEYTIALNGDWNGITSGAFTVKSSADFGLKRTGEDVLWFSHRSSKPDMKFRVNGNDSLTAAILEWSHSRKWTEVVTEKRAAIAHDVMGLKSEQLYSIYCDGEMVSSIQSDRNGTIRFTIDLKPNKKYLFEVRRTQVPRGFDPNGVLSVPLPDVTPRDTLVFLPGTVTVRMSSETGGAVIRYTLDGTVPDSASQLYSAPVVLKSTTTVCARAWREGLAESPVTTSTILFVPKDSTGIFRLGDKEIFCHKAFGAKVKLKYPYSPQYAGSGPNALTDGMLGTDRYEANWQGFEEHNLDATIDMGRMKSVDSVRVGFLANRALWIYLPEKVEFWVSKDGRDFEPMKSVTSVLYDYGNGFSRSNYVASTGGIRCRYIRVRALNIGRCPSGDPGAGGKAWLFADTIIVE